MDVSDRTWPEEHTSPAEMPVDRQKRYEIPSADVIVRKQLLGSPAVTRRADIDVRCVTACEAYNTCTYGEYQRVMQIKRSLRISNPLAGTGESRHALQVNPT